MSHAYVWPNSSVVREHVHYEWVLDSSPGRVMGGGGEVMSYMKKNHMPRLGTQDLL